MAQIGRCAGERETGGEADGVLLRHADVEGALGKRLGEEIETRTRRHRRSDGNDLVVLLGLLDQALREHLGVARRIGLGRHLRAGDDIEPVDAMGHLSSCLRRRIAFALLGDDVHQDRPLLGVAHVPQNGSSTLRSWPSMGPR